ncbi:helix-turn-helix domain-containing protein [Weissella soli]|uniref:helix-turn-helix domain-containing protein n=1 Tax=Weissella soli TaxID=155866 RepID=UPI0021C24B9C|nr:helix-turn-helix domain-containing protein [Weissella soli]MCT8395214.1 helix-turn-helix domain-containing protein [Weissella soli]
MTTFNERVQNIWKEKRPDIKSVRKLEEKIGLSNGTIASWKKSSPSKSKMEQVADFFGVSVDYLLGNTDDMHSNKQDDMPIDLEETLSKLGPAVSFGGKELTDEQKLKFYEMAKLMFGD